MHISYFYAKIRIFATLSQALIEALQNKEWERNSLVSNSYPHAFAACEQRVFSPHSQVAYFKLKSAADTHCPAKVAPVKFDLVEMP